MAESIEEIYSCINANESFLLDAGAGSGKTYTLMQTLDFLQNKSLLKNQKILCITYTNAGKDEILKRLRYKNLKNEIVVSTIHDFIWEYIKNFKPELNKILKIFISEEKEKLNQEIIDAKRKIENPRYNTNIIKNNEIIDINTKRLNKYNNVDVDELEVDYDLYKAFYRGKISHDEIIKIAVYLINNNFFAKLLFENFPYIFIDEYQDTKKELVEILLKQSKILNSLIGLYGDKMQQIYEKEELLFDSIQAKKISKLDNYRTNKSIVLANNELRADGLKQNCDCQNPLVQLDKLMFIYNKSEDITLSNFSEIQDYFHSFKRLYLSNKNIASEIGFLSISLLFSNEYDKHANEKLLKLEDPLMQFIINNVIKMVEEFSRGIYKNIIPKLPITTMVELSQYKINIENAFNKTEKPISMLIDYCLENKLINKFRLGEIKEQYETDFYNNLLNVSLNEFIALNNQISGKTSLDTLHGVKGQEFDKVIVNLFQNQPWTTYNFDKLINGVELNSKSVINAHKLLYVACTRAKSSLIINYIADTSQYLDFKILTQNIKKLMGVDIEILEYI